LSAHIITAVIGSGVLSLAWAIAQLGWVAGPRVYTAGCNNVKFCGLAQYGNLVGVSIGYTITAYISMV
uniref:Amino acid transporter transmembrane domain-containing protein n=1 Tax=Cucumis melo TaxID=3656 RepID=A0A9I9CCV5_CUCME